jgi:hypothetical protein
MAGINARVACTLDGGVVGRRIGGTEGGGIGSGIVSWRGAWRVGGFTGGTLDVRQLEGHLGYSCWRLQCHHCCHRR